MSKVHHIVLIATLLVSPSAAAQEIVERVIEKPAERHLPLDEPYMRWAHDPDLLEHEVGDKLEDREVVKDHVETVKLRDLVPPIRFESGVAKIPPSYIEKLRGILEDMRDLHNVRLHLIGHADDQPLSNRLVDVFGDNAGLSRERAGEVAEFIQTALSLPPEAISFEWAGDSQPVATNATAAGRALNRRVEVEVWYDEISEKTAVEEVVVPEDIKRVKICRMETVCKLRYREGHEHRARVKNLVVPLHFDDETVGVSEAFIRQVGEAFHNLRDKRNVTAKFVGFTDDVPLEGRAQRIYGTHLALSKARARRVALAVKDALDLPTAAVASDGRGAARPIASNETPRGRALNRRIEVEFWHDDPLQELPDEPQPCPDAPAAELVTRVYDPPWGRIAPLPIEDGEASIPPGYTDILRRAMADLADKTNLRLRFVGYTSNERLDRRTAMVYGDDIGLSTARARRTMERIQADLGLSESQAEHEGRGYVHADDVVNAGFLQGDTSYVMVQVVYDELAVTDDYEGIDITPITRELSPKSPLGLNLMRITVDGEPIDDPGRSSADIQRCTDVALERADIRFRFDSLEFERRLSVTAAPIAVPLQSSAEGAGAPTALFRMYTNYPYFIRRSEVRIFDQDQSLQATPLEVIEVGPSGLAEWHPGPELLEGPARKLSYVLRAYDGDGRFDETRPQSLWLTHGKAADARHVARSADAARSDAAPDPEEGRGKDRLLAGYGEDGLAVENIPLGSVGAVEVHGSSIPPRHRVWLAGNPVPVDERGSFVAEAILPSGMHTVEVAVLDDAGNGELFLRDLELERNDWFYVGIADLTFSWNMTDDVAESLTGADAPYDLDSPVDGRLAFYVSGKFGEDWRLTASADTREGPVEDLFSNFLDKSPDSLFRRLDPDYHYPTFGDDGTVEENAPTSGKFYLKVNKGESHLLWGNFNIGYLENELAQVDRGLYGANLHHQSPAATRFGEHRLVLDGFAAQPGTVVSREEFRGTGGSLYFLRRRDLLIGSEQVRLEVRDKVSGLVTSVVHLRPARDYDIDYLQGRILLSEPMGSTVEDRLLVRSDGLSGNETWLVVQYEYTPGLDELDGVATGGQGHYWINDFVRVGLTASYNDEGDVDSSLYGADVTLRKSAETWFKLQTGRSEGLVSSPLHSDDGGFTFLDAGNVALHEAAAWGYRADLSLGVGDLLEGRSGRLSFYAQSLEKGYSAPGLNTLADTLQFGSAVQIPVTDRVELASKTDRRIQEGGLETTSQEVDVVYRLTDRWKLGAGGRYELREDQSPVVPVTQEQGERADAVVQLGYDSKGRWRAHGFGQATLLKSGGREDNHRIGVGGAYRISDRLMFDGEASVGSLGPAAKLGTSYQQSEETKLYLSYALGDELADTGLHERRGSLIYGAKLRLSDSSSVYVENGYQHGGSATGLTRAFGMSLAPTDRWNLGTNWETGTLIDRQTHAEMRRHAGGIHAGYAFDAVRFSSAIEYRFDETEQLDGTWTDRRTWLFRNTLNLQWTPDWRVIGKLNHAISESSLGEFYDGGYTEGVFAFAFRPVEHDRLNALAKYTYFYNVPNTEQISLRNEALEFIQKSHVLSLDLTYDVTSYWSVGGKYAYRLGQVSLERENPVFFDNNAHLFILRTDLRFFKYWEATLEGRMLSLTDLGERRAGALVGIYRHLGEHLKIGVGYNFTDFSDNLTDLSYDHQGVFLSLTGTL